MTRSERVFFLLVYIAVTALLFLAVIAVEHSAVYVIYNANVSGCHRGDTLRTLLTLAFHSHPNFPLVNCVIAYPAP